ncbi:hypothetical protein CFE70_004429 [Pyrenophora teres f. teres 0-1]|uniref:Uncharacterized protein n=1 Tax=Pyrenophora teres f. teres (strain 0-1) TaxID=861557 RepID=E3RNK2_PYRTT|nr:hypothetical protein PTT_10152 [Pyrenophora teres f. teres 0-1]
MIISEDAGVPGAAAKGSPSTPNANVLVVGPEATNGSTRILNIVNVKLRKNSMSSTGSSDSVLLANIKFDEQNLESGAAILRAFEEYAKRYRDLVATDLFVDWGA